MTLTSSSAPLTDTGVPLPTRLDVVRLLQREAAAARRWVSGKTARYTSYLFARAYAQMKSSPLPEDAVFVLSDQDMKVVERLLTVIMPEGQIAQPGSAHEALDLLYLPPGNSFARSTVVHDGKAKWAVILITTVNTTAA